MEGSFLGGGIESQIKGGGEEQMFIKNERGKQRKKYLLEKKEVGSEDGRPATFHSSSRWPSQSSVAARQAASSHGGIFWGDLSRRAR